MQIDQRVLVVRGILGRMDNGVIHRDPEVMSGELVFVGTRVPVYSLFDHLEAGDPLETFLEDFPSVTKEQALAVLKMAREALDVDANSDR